MLGLGFQAGSCTLKDAVSSKDRILQTPGTKPVRGALLRQLINPSFEYTLSLTGQTVATEKVHVITKESTFQAPTAIPNEGAKFSSTLGIHVQNQMETAMVYWGLYRDNGKSNGNCYGILGFI